MVELLEAAVTEMHRRAADFGGRTRTFAVSVAFPFLVVVIDELAFLTAYQPNATSANAPKPPSPPSPAKAARSGSAWSARYRTRART